MCTVARQPKQLYQVPRGALGTVLNETGREKKAHFNTKIIKATYLYKHKYDTSTKEINLELFLHHLKCSFILFSPHCMVPVKISISSLIPGPLWKVQVGVGGPRRKGCRGCVAKHRRCGAVYTGGSRGPTQGVHQPQCTQAAPGGPPKEPASPNVHRRLRGAHPPSPLAPMYLERFGACELFPPHLVLCEKQHFLQNHNFSF